MSVERRLVPGLADEEGQVVLRRCLGSSHLIGCRSHFAENVLLFRLTILWAGTRDTPKYHKTKKIKERKKKRIKLKETGRKKKDKNLLFLEYF